MTTHGVIAIVAVCAVLVLLAVGLVIRGKLYVGYAVIWISLLTLAALFVAVPPLTALVTRLTGAEWPASALTLVALVLIVLILIYYSVQLSILGRRMTRVAQELGTLMMNLRESHPPDDDR